MLRFETDEHDVCSSPFTKSFDLENLDNYLSNGTIEKEFI